MNRSRKLDTNNPQIELISFGDKIPNGTFTVHSRFRRSVNFHNNSILISIVNEDIGGGPLNIIVRGLDLQIILSLSIYNTILNINNMQLLINDIMKYSSKLSLKSGSISNLENNLAFVQISLLSVSTPKSLCFILDEKREADFSSGFEKEFVKRMKSGVDLILKGSMTSLIEGISKIKGCGFGLTPSGDDFLAGLLSGLYVKQQIEGNDLSQVRNVIFTHAKGQNLISNSYFTCAYKGLFNERFKNFIISLFDRNLEQLESKIETLLKIGATSGADTLVGFMFAWKKAGKLWS